MKVTKFSKSFSNISKIQEDYIRQLKRIRPKYILYNSAGTNFDLTYNVEAPEIYERLKIVNSYIISNYMLHKKFDGYEILKKK